MSIVILHPWSLFSVNFIINVHSGSQQGPSIQSVKNFPLIKKELFNTFF